MKKLTIFFLTLTAWAAAGVLSAQKTVPPEVMNRVYEEVKTPYKYGPVMVPDSPEKMVDSPSIFPMGEKWYMTYIVFDGQGYESWIAESSDLLQWKTLGRILSFTRNTWDANQKAGYIALQEYDWGGSYEVKPYDGQYWMSYLGGATQGYEAGMLGIGMAYTDQLTIPKEWSRLTRPVMLPTDKDARWYESETIYKSLVIHDPKQTLGAPFVMFYNAKNKKQEGGATSAERIAIALSDNMKQWRRYSDSTVIDHGSGISGDAFITRMDNLWVMFYFGAFWKPGAFDRFACSYDLVHWTRWEGDDLVAPSEPYDNEYAHKPLVFKHNGVVYHYYCSVNKAGERTISLATSTDLGKSTLRFPQK